MKPSTHVVFSIFIGFILCQSNAKISMHHLHFPKAAVEKEKFYVKSPSCRIPKTNPFASDIMKNFKQQHFDECGTDKDIVSREFIKEFGQYRLRVHGNNVSCQYQAIHRVEDASTPDNDFSLSNPQPLDNFFLVPKDIEYMTIKCYANSSTNQTLLQEDAFLFVQDRRPTKSIPPKKAETKPNVIILGIDSTSRMNLRRSMPKVRELLRKPGWFEMQGYNKVGENTLPNLLAILTGNAREEDAIDGAFRHKGYFDRLNFIWKRYKEHGYVTAFGEDCQGIGTFNYLKRGFEQQPVDYYLRNFMVALEKTLKTVQRFENVFCLGRRLSSSYVWDLAGQLVQRFQNSEPVFGLFWSNSFTHNEFTGASALDKVLYEYLLYLDVLGLFEESIVLLVSDHGYRFGASRMNARSGYLEERLPMMFLYVPPWFREKYPQYVANLIRNRNRLSSNYDLHMTLHHILQLNTTSAGLFDPRLQADNCKECHSLFFELPHNRSCSQAGIPKKWCSCKPVRTVTDQNFVRGVAKEVVRQMNQHLRDRSLTDICREFSTVRVLHMDRQIAVTENEDSVEEDELDFVITFAINNPTANFEAPVQWSKETKLLSMNVDHLSRLDSYKKTGKCTEDPIVKKYCICIER